MSYVTILLHHDADDWISRLIRVITRARRTTHVAMRSLSGDVVIEASAVGSPKGVRKVRFDEWAARHPGYREKRLHHRRPDMVWLFARTQIGKPYDWRYFVGWLLRRNWQSNEAWVCQELIAWAAEQAGQPLFHPDAERNWITPRDFELLPECPANERTAS